MTTAAAIGREKPLRADQLARRTGPRVRRWLLRTYPMPRTKAVARDFGCSFGLAAKWMSGDDPTIRAFSAMVERWGVEFLAFIFEEAFAEARVTRGGATIHPPAAAAIGDAVAVVTRLVAGAAPEQEDRRLMWLVGSSPATPYPAPVNAALELLASRIGGYPPAPWRRLGWAIAARVDALIAAGGFAAPGTVA